MRDDVVVVIVIVVLMVDRRLTCWFSCADG